MTPASDQLRVVDQKEAVQNDTECGQEWAVVVCGREQSKRKNDHEQGDREDVKCASEHRHVCLGRQRVEGKGDCGEGGSGTSLDDNVWCVRNGNECNDKAKRDGKDCQQDVV